MAPEQRFVLHAAGLAPGGEVDNGLCSRLAAGISDWRMVVQDLARHGLVGIAVPALLRSPAITGPARQALQAEHAGHVVAAMQRLRELVRISGALDAAGIRHLFIKGIVLSVQLYADPVARGGKDIDIMVERARIADAGAVLRTMGYRLPINAEPATGGEEEPPKESAWVHGESRILVEIHDRLCGNHALLPWDFELLWAERETVMVGGTAVPAMARRRLPVYLAVHGIRHGWQRLMWLADLAACFNRDPDWQGVLDDSATLDLQGMMLHVGWALHGWLAQPVPVAILAQGARRVDVRLLNWLVARCHAALQTLEVQPRNSLRRFLAGSLWGRLITYVMKPTRAFWASQLAFDMVSPHDRAAFALPDRFVWLYPLLRPFGWAIRRMRG